MKSAKPLFSKFVEAIKPQSDEFLTFKGNVEYDKFDLERGTPFQHLTLVSSTFNLEMVKGTVSLIKDSTVYALEFKDTDEKSVFLLRDDEFTYSTLRAVDGKVLVNFKKGGQNFTVEFRLV